MKVEAESNNFTRPISGGAYIAVAAKPTTGGKGGVMYYLGGHRYRGDAINQINGRRMYLNSIFVPSTRPATCNFTFATQDVGVTLQYPFSSVCPDEEFKYQVVVENSAVEPATDVVVDVSLDPSLIFSATNTST